MTCSIQYSNGSFTDSPIDVSVDVENVKEHLLLGHLGGQSHGRQTLPVHDRCFSSGLVCDVEQVLQLNKIISILKINNIYKSYRGPL